MNTVYVTAPTGTASGYNNPNVATNVCGDLPSLIPTSIDCSLCTIGWPMAGGTVRIEWFGPRCNGPTADPSPSYWLGIEPRYYQLKCINPGDDAEPNPGAWAGEGIFSGAGPAAGGCANTYKLRAVVTAAPSGDVTCNVTVWWLNASQAWPSYTSLSASMSEVSPGAEPWRGRNFNSGFLPITVSTQGGKGDPVSFARIVVGLQGMRAGCGGSGNGDPICGMWDGSGWHTCFRAHIEGASVVGGLTQLGFNPNPCGATGQTPCGCDVITLRSSGVHDMVNNTDQAFATEYGSIGVPGEAVNVPQQVQVGGPLCVKQVNGGSIYIGYKSGGTWSVQQATQVQATSPNILRATFASVTVWLYSLRFPSAGILPGECGGSDPNSGSMVAQMLPPTEPEEPDEPTPVQQQAAALIDRMRHPCMHRGGRLALMGYG